MKKIAIICNIASAWLILDTFDAWHNLLMFLFVGIIPGTKVSLSASQMMILMFLLAVLILVRLTKQIAKQYIGNNKLKPTANRHLKQA